MAKRPAPIPKKTLTNNLSSIKFSSLSIDSAGQNKFQHHNTTDNDQNQSKLLF